jgi:uncharacterized protein YjbI with pentapeptide repeats
MAQGAGLIDGYAALFTAPAGLANQTVAPGNGTGSLELSRGTVHVDLLGVDGSLTHVDGNTAAALTVYNPTMILGPWNPAAWFASNWNGQNWSGQNWSGQNWSGQNWSGQNWSGQNWSGQNWSGQNWSGSAWYGAWDQ